jgi:hypothetical protein
MAQRHKVSISTRKDTYRPTADERRAARNAEVAGKQGQLKQEAAERRALREQQVAADGPVSSIANRRRVPTAGAK